LVLDYRLQVFLPRTTGEKCQQSRFTAISA
jgi:hypothetical protein